MNYVLGIDVGGTKYHLRAEKESGRTVDLVVPSQGNLHLLGAKKMASVLDGHVKALKRKMGTRQSPSAVVIGMSGFNGPPETTEMLRAVSAKTWWKSVDPNRRQIHNDIQIGLRAGTDAPYAIAVIAGTGSNGYAIDLEGNEAGVSGRGMHIAGQGSGYDMGIRALKAARKAEDGRGPATRLLAALCTHLKVKDTQGMVDRVHAESFGKKGLSDLNRVVETVAEKGDRVARAIIQDCAEEIVLMATALHKQLHFGRSKVDVVFIGGVVNKNKPLRRAVISKMRKHRWALPVFLDSDPVEGAIKMAKETGR